MKREDLYVESRFKDAHPDTDWKVIVAMRHFLVHGYYQVDPEEVWNVKARSSAFKRTSRELYR